MSRKPSVFLLVSGGFFLSAAVLRAFLGDIFELVFILAFVVPIGVFIAGIALLWNSAFVWRTSKLAALAGVAIILAGGWVHFLGGKDWVFRARFWCVQSCYEAKLARVLEAVATDGNADALKLDDLAEVDKGPPVRVAFYWNRRVIDNWVGLVYDPTGEVMRVNAFKSDWSNWHAPELATIKSLFGGDLFRALHLSGHWYLCWFT